MHRRGGKKKQRNKQTTRRRAQQFARRDPHDLPPLTPPLPRSSATPHRTSVMGCGGSTARASVQVEVSSRSQGEAAAHRVKTPSTSSSSGVSSCRHSPSLKNGNRSGNQGRDLNQNKYQNAAQQLEEQVLVEQLMHQTKAEEEEGKQEEQARTGDKHGQEQVQADEVKPQEAAFAVQQQEQITQSKLTEGCRSFTPVEIARHNAEVGWVEWIPHKGKVYDGSVFRHYFPAYVENRLAMLEARARQRVENGEDEEEKEFTTFTTHMLYYIPPINDASVWKVNGVVVLRYHCVSEEEIAKELPPFFMGNITGTRGAPYWTNFRSDVHALLGDLRAKSEEDKTPGEQEYLAVLTRWQDRYGTEDPPEHPPPSDGTDPNEKSYPLPVDPESLRVWVLEWEPFDVTVPPEGAWGRQDETEAVDLGDPHETFAATLRTDFHSTTEEFVFNIEGDAAWELLPDTAIKDEAMTPKQEEIQAARDKRTDLSDPERMKKRREQLCDYFIKTREIAPSVVMPFLQWATLMEANMEELEKLCNA